MALIKHAIPAFVYGWCILIIFLAINIDVFYSTENNFSIYEQNDIVFKIFGQLRYDIAAMLYLKSDSYYHGGTIHKEGHEHTIYDEMQDKECHKREEYEHIENKSKDFFLKINHAINYQPITHLQKTQNAEIMPWFKMAVIVDPNFIPAYVMGGFWLTQFLQKPEQALKFLKQGLRYNPDAWEIYAQIGDIYFFSNKDYKKAINYLKKAYLLMETSTAKNLEKRTVLLLIASSSDRIKDYKQSLYYYKKLKSLFPEDRAITDRIIDLEKISNNGKN